MKILLINGSPNEDGCTNKALEIINEELKNEGIDTKLFYIGKKPISGCIACGRCRKERLGKCSIDDCVNDAIAIMKECDALIIGSPVHFASPAGNFLSFLDRFFYSCNDLALKPGAAIISARRAGTTASLDVLNKYFLISNMPLVSSSYWNMVHGSNKTDVLQDLEGIQTMRNLAKNMAWLLKSIERGKECGIPKPELSKKERTNFIRNI